MSGLLLAYLGRRSPLISKHLTMRELNPIFIDVSKPEIDKRERAMDHFLKKQPFFSLGEKRFGR